MIEITIPQKVLTPDYESYSLTVSGDAGTFQRRVIISVPLVDADGALVDTKTVALSGIGFNAFWTGFSSDKAAIKALFPDADVSSVPDTIINNAN